MRCRWPSALLSALVLAGAAHAQQADPPAAPVDVSPPKPAEASSAAGGATPTPPASTTRSGREIYQRFREGLADPECPADSSPRWRAHFSAAPKRLASPGDDVLPLFGYVVDAVRAASLPTEYALIPFVESGYKPGARSPGGPAGLWQFIALTARNHQVPVRPGYDGRLSPVESTRAAVRYLKTLHGMFAGDWRLAVMAYNAGEYRVLGALRRSGQNARNARPERLVGLSGITHAYVKKLRALSCLFEQAEDRDEWLRALDRPVPLLQAQVLPADARELDRWSATQGLDPAAVRRLNPAFAGGRIARGTTALRVLAPLGAGATPVEVAIASPPSSPAVPVVAPVAAPGATQPTAAAAATTAEPSPRQRSHTVARGESLWTIARRYRVATSELIARNKLDAGARLRPGMVLRIDDEPAAAP